MKLSTPPRKIPDKGLYRLYPLLQSASRTHTVPIYRSMGFFSVPRCGRRCLAC